MSEIAVPTRRYSAAISYRRVDGTRVATRLRNALRRYRFPRGFDGASLREIYLDRAYQRADPHFFASTIQPALADADHLIVIVTPAVFTRKQPDEPNWVEREVAWFRDDLQRGDKIVIARADDEPGSKLPAFLADYEAADQVDVRGFATQVWRWIPSVGGEVARIVATLIDTRKLPELRREEERSRTIRLLFALVAAIVVAGTTTAFAAAAWLSRQAEQRATAHAEQRTIDALRAANAREAARREAEAEKQRAEQQRLRAEEQVIQTDRARLETRRTFARADLDTAIDLLENDDDAARALAYLSRAVRTDPENASVRGLIYDLLLRRHWALPLTVAPRSFSAEEALSRVLSGDQSSLASERIRRAKPVLHMPPDVDGEVLAHDATGTIYFARSLEGESWVFDARAGRVLSSKRVVNYARPHDAAFSPTEPLVAVSPSDESGCTSVFQYDGTRRYGPFCHDRDIGAKDGRFMSAASVAFSPDGRSLASGGHDLRIWDLVTGAMIVCRYLPPRPPMRWVDHLAYFDSERILVKSIAGISLWTPQANGCTSEFLARTAHEPTHFAWLRRGRDGETHLIAASSNKEILAWSSHLPNQHFLSIDVAAEVTALSASKDGTRVAAAMGDGTSRVWSTRDGTPLIERFVGSGERLSSDGEMLMGTHDHHTVVWSVGGGAAIPRLIEGKSPEELFPTQPERNFTVAITRPDRLEVRDATRKAVAHLDVPQHRLDVFAVRNDGLIAVAAWTRTILWNYRTSERAELEHGLPAAESLEFSRDGSLILMRRDLTHELWSVAEKRRLRQWPRAGTSVRFSSDARIVIEDGDGARLFHTTTGEAASSRPILEGDTGAILSPDNARVFAGDRLWDRASGRPLGGSLGFDDYGLGVYAFSTDGERLAASIDNETYIIDVPDGDPADAPYLAAVAELIGGWHLDEAGQLLRRPLETRTLAKLRTLAQPPGASDEARKVAAWLAQDRGRRGASPWMQQTLADVIRQCKDTQSAKPNGCAPVVHYIPDPTF